MGKHERGLGDAPDEILLLIFRHLNHLALNASRLVNKQWHHCASDNHLFDFPLLPFPLTTKVDGRNY